MNTFDVQLRFQNEQPDVRREHLYLFYLHKKLLLVDQRSKIVNFQHVPEHYLQCLGVATHSMEFRSIQYQALFS